MSEGIDPGTVATVARALREARSVLFVTGAGISADSGLPTYRGIGGLYERETTEEGVPIEVALSGETLRSDPALCWKYMAQIGRACRGAKPNRAHEIIAAIERSKERCWVLTQNVDGFHHAAGSRNVIEIHGNMGRLLCLACGRRDSPGDLDGLELPPRCPDCGGAVRPEVVLFGEMLPMDAVSRLQAQLQLGFDLTFSIGTTSVFPYIAEPVVATRNRGGVTVEINPGTSSVSHIVDHRIAAGAAAAMEAIAAVGANNGA